MRSFITIIRRGLRLVFLFFGVYSLPVWIVMLEATNNLGLVWQGVSLALLAPLYIAAGLYLRYLNPDYTWPLYCAGYTLTAIGAMIAFDDQRIAMYVLTLDIAVYAASAVIHRQPFWLHLATFLAPITLLIALNYYDRFTAPWIASCFTPLASAYYGIGQLLEWQKSDLNQCRSICAAILCANQLDSPFSTGLLSALSPEGLATTWTMAGRTIPPMVQSGIVIHANLSVDGKALLEDGKLVG